MTTPERNRVYIGSDVWIEVRALDGVISSIVYWHARPDNGAPCSGYVPVKPNDANGWDVVSAEPLTLSPSLLCRVCGHHGHIRGGKWVAQ